MTEIFATSTVKRGIPQLNHSSIIIKTPSGAATGDTLDVSAYFDEIYLVYIADSTGVVKTATFNSSTRVITIGTITTGTHFLEVKGIKN